MLRSILSALLCAAMLVPTASFGDESSAAAVFAGTGIVFSAEQARRDDRWLRLADYWTPTTDDVARIEANLKAFLEASPDREAQRVAANLDRYRRQYVGYSHDHGKWIFINAFCDEYVKHDLKGDDRVWHEQLVVVVDGGSCFFNVHYKLSPPGFERLWINGEG